MPIHDGWYNDLPNTWTGRTAWISDVECPECEQNVLCNGDWLYCPDCEICTENR